MLTDMGGCATKGAAYGLLITTSPRHRCDPESSLHCRVGASTHPAKQGHAYVNSLREFGFEGRVYPVNPRAEEIAGYGCYKSLKDVPGPVDYVSPPFRPRCFPE